MQRGKIVATMVLAGALLLGWAPGAPAQEAPLKTVFQDALYGGMTGALVGGAILAFDHNSRDDLSYVLYGAATGVIVGTFYGLVTAPRPLARFEGGALRLAVPTPVPTVVAGNDGRPALGVRADLFQARF
jgi:hypothetical protein